MAAEDASFRISIDAMSLGLRKFSGFELGIDPKSVERRPARALLPSRGNQSTTYNGSPPAEIEAIPLTLTTELEPASPLPVVT